jgi:hypothetical protein
MLLQPPRRTSADAVATERPDMLAPLLAFALTAAGAAAFTCGAIYAAWPVWVAGIAAVVAGLLVYRP